MLETSAPLHHPVMANCSPRFAATDRRGTVRLEAPRHIPNTRHCEAAQPPWRSIGRCKWRLPMDCFVGLRPPRNDGGGGVQCHPPFAVTSALPRQEVALLTFF